VQVKVFYLPRAEHPVVQSLNLVVDTGADGAILHSELTLAVYFLKRTAVGHTHMAALVLYDYIYHLFKVMRL
jgi:hypothetical protein